MEPPVVPCRARIADSSPVLRDGTIPLDDTYAETEEYQGRVYQQYALTNGTYFAPVDEVRFALEHGLARSPNLTAVSRERSPV